MVRVRKTPVFKACPAMMTNVKLNVDGKIMANEWIRDAGVDVIHSTTREGSTVAALFVTGGETGYNKEKGGFMITYDLSKADNETKTKFIADAPGYTPDNGRWQQCDRALSKGGCILQ